MPVNFQKGGNDQEDQQEVTHYVSSQVPFPFWLFGPDPLPLSGSVYVVGAVSKILVTIGFHGIYLHSTP